LLAVRVISGGGGDCQLTPAEYTATCCCWVLGIAGAASHCQLWNARHTPLLLDARHDAARTGRSGGDSRPTARGARCPL